MKTLLVAALVAATPALAGELPISTIYGTPTACRLYAELGPDGVIYSDDDSVLLVRPAGALTREATCSPVGMLGAVTMSCNEGDAPFTWDVTLTLNEARREMTWTDVDGTVILHECPSAQATM